MFCAGQCCCCCFFFFVIVITLSFFSCPDHHFGLLIIDPFFWIPRFSSSLIMPSPSIEHLCNGASTFLSPTSDRGLLTSLNHSLSFVKLNRRSVSPTSLKPLNCSRRYAEIGKKRLFFRWGQIAIIRVPTLEKKNNNKKRNL